MSEHILHKLIELNFTISCLKTEYLKYIHDKEYPIGSRWDVYCTAPSDMKVHQSWYADFKSLPNNFIGYNMPVHTEKHGLTEIMYLLDRVKFWNLTKNQIDLIHIDALKEEILEMNIKSFEFD